MSHCCCRRGCMLLPLISFFLFFFFLVQATEAAAAAAAAAATEQFCDPTILNTCPQETFIIPYDEFVSTWPVIEYCLHSEKGFLPVPQEACESLAEGTWTVRPEWAQRAAAAAASKGSNNNISSSSSPSSLTLPEQYVCAVCAARNASARAPLEPCVWILTLSNQTSYTSTTFATWGSRLGNIRLDQLIVSPTGQRYLFALAPFNLVQELVRDARFVLNAMPMPAELKISPRVTDPTSLLVAQSSSPSNTTAANNNRNSAVLSVRTLIDSHEDVSHRAAHHDQGLLAIHKALGLPMPRRLLAAAAAKDDGTTEEEEAHASVVGDQEEEEEEEIGPMPSSCENCTVETAGDGNYVVSSVPVMATAEVARTISQALASALVIDLALHFELFNKEANILLQSGTNSTNGGSTWLWRQGIKGDGAVVGLADTGLDTQCCFFHDSAHPVTFESVYDEAVGEEVAVFQSEEHRTIREYFGFADGKEGVNSGHGTHVCGSVVGFPAEMTVTSKGYAYKGAAYGSKVAFFDIGRPGDAMLYIPSDLSTGLFPRTYALGGRIHSNSWGSSISDNSAEMYQTDAYLWHHQDFVIVYAAGNEGPDAYTIGTPASAKNAIAVGATTNNVAVPDVAYFSSRGPTFDMRYGIDVTAPGFYVASAYSQVDGATNQCYIQGMAGTSMAAPLVAGTAVLLREYLSRGFYPLGWPSPDHAFVPMGALLKAVLINSALQSPGLEANKHNTNFIKYPNYDQGFGMVAAKFATYFQGEVNPNVLFVDGAWSEDCVDCPQLRQGRNVLYTVVPTRSTPIKITLAYYDYPAAVTISSKTLINDLDLTARQNGTRFFANGWTSTAGPNSLNNVEQIVISNPIVGMPITVTIAAVSVAAGPQPYALAMTGQFRKDHTLFNDALPMVTSVATDGTQVLLMGRNLPRSPKHPQSYAWTCVSDPFVGLDAKVVSYSPATAQFLVVNLNTTKCTSFRVQIVSDGFLGNVSEVLTYNSAAPISTLCAVVATDDTCWGLNACTGNCLQQQQQPPQQQEEQQDNNRGDMGLHTILVVALVCLLLLSCCGGGVYVFLNKWRRADDYPKGGQESTSSRRKRHPAAMVTVLPASRVGLHGGDGDGNGNVKAPSAPRQQQHGNYVAYASPGRRHG